MHKPDNIAIIGATGSIGRQTLDIIGRRPDLYRAYAMAAGSNVEALIELALAHRPAIAVIADEKGYARLKEALEPAGIRVAAGAEAVASIASHPDVDTVVTATVGYSGLAPTIAAIAAGKRIALANKETLVVAGALIKRLLEHSPSRIYPVDSEHSAIYQCLQGEDRAMVSKLIITASGGPFRTWTQRQMQAITPADALRHPNWNMGAKITIDSATMVNKAFEIIEARWLFDIEPERIEAVVHPQSIVHSMVQFADGAIKAQLGEPDMRLPIAYALGRASRMEGASAMLTLDRYASLTFERPDIERFPCLTLAHKALELGGTAACAINAANEVAVASFLKGELPFRHIYTVISDTLERSTFVDTPRYDDYVAVNAEARAKADEAIRRIV